MTNSIVLIKTLEISIHDLADTFCEMDCEQQAEFFNRIAKNVETDWDYPFTNQAVHIRDAENLTPEGLEIMNQLGSSV